MNEQLLDCLTNPVKCKLFLAVAAKKRATAKQLTETHPDIPLTSLYRYLKNMTESGILQVVEEHQIRGTVERVYAVAVDFAADIKKIMAENDGQGYMLLFSGFVTGLMREFREYAGRADIDLLRDGSGFTTAPVYATREELEQAIREIGAIIYPLTQNKQTEGRRLHSISIITTPPKTSQTEAEDFDA
jgi:hypothetical protein